ncbi:MAG TPA: ferritin-like domain-containing protein [Polyangia bacterium]|nr:ferritin-like domain-containing protein [Polyangia bacterium]
MSWNDWRQHFEANRGRPLPPVTPPADLSPALASALARSLARFQVGEAGEGRIVRQIARCRLAGVDADYQRALELFVAEEGRHARILAAAVRALGGRLLAITWSERLFVFGRRLCGVRLKLLVLLAAEVIGVGFYGLLASRLPRAGLRAALEQMCDDERAHLRFHQDFFRTQAARGWRRLLFRVTFHLVGPAAALVVLCDHRRTLRQLGVGLGATARDLARLVASAGRLEAATCPPAPAVAVAVASVAVPS